jgi:hypothetical protein
VSGTPSTSTATCRGSEPRTEISASPRLFVRTWIAGRLRSTCSRLPAAGSGSESSAARMALLPPRVVSG